MVRIRGQAVIYMVMDQRTLGVGDRLFNSMKLLGHIGAGAPVFQHRKHFGQMALSPSEPRRDVGM